MYSLQRSRAALLAGFILLTLFAATPSLAEWTPDGVSLLSGGPRQIISDLAGGAESSNGIRVDASGNPVWTVGTILSSNICPDGSGGMVIAYANGDVYAQRVTQSGTNSWGGSVVVCSAVNTQSAATIASDGQGGVILVWLDGRVGGTTDIYAARLDPSGNALWVANGVPVCVANGVQSDLAVMGDGVGGAFVVWHDPRSGVAGPADLYAQHLNASGAPLWTVDGIPVCNAAGDQAAPVLASDGAGGMYVAWWDARGGAYDVYLQRVNAAGVSVFASNGVLAAGGAYDQLFPVLVADGSGGVFLAWEDHRTSGGNGSDVYLKRFGSNGAMVWPAEVGICTEPHLQTRPSMVPDALGGVIVCWPDSRVLGPSPGTYYGPYAQRVDSSGNPLWSANGVPANLEASTVSSAISLAADGTGGALFQGTVLTNGGVRLYRLLADGTPAWVQNFAVPTVAAADVAADEGGAVRLTITAPLADTRPLSPNPTMYEVWRKSPDASALRIGAPPRNSVLASAPANALSGIVLPPGTWDVVSNIIANGAPTYRLIVPTRADSSAAGSADETYVVMTQTANRSVFAFGSPVAVHSTDNLAPPAPSLFMAGRSGNTNVRLSWEALRVADLWHYSLYRGSAVDFPRDAAHRIAQPTGTEYTDNAYVAGSYYEVTATDRHGNEGIASVLAPSEIASVAPGVAPTKSFVGIVGANPFRHSAVVEYGLAAEGRTTLEVYDLNGRRVTTLLSGTQPAGVRRVVWDGPASAGVYLVRFAAPGVAQTVRLIRVE